MAATVLLLLAASGLRAGGRLAGGAQQSGRRNLIMVATAPVGPPKTDAIRIRGSKLAVADALPLRIEGQWYDVSGWADEHPGGRWLLEYARGRDVTALFRAIHLRNEGVASAALSRLPQLHASELPLPSSSGLPPSALQAEGALQGEYVFSYGSPPASPPLPPIDSALRSELRAMLRREFPDVGAAKATAGHWVRTALALAGTLACWAGWLGGSLPATAALPLVHWVLIAHTVHEATHGNLSTDPRINYWFQFTSHPICFNVFVWIPQHLLSHHQYTNDFVHDADCHHFAPAMLSSTQPRVQPLKPGFNHGWTFVWKAFLTTIGTSVLQPMRTLLESATPNYEVNVTPVPAAVSKPQLLLSVLPSFFVLLYPLVGAAAGAFSLPQAAFLWAWPWVGMSLIFTCMTQVSHVQAATQPDAPGGGASASCWTSRQIAASLDYSVPAGPTGRASPLEMSVVTALSAGLNVQSLHHAMPSVGCAHFPRLYAEYAAICDRHGVRLRQSDNAATAVGEMLRYVFDNNAPEAARADRTAG